ncbi:hypothetical protein TUM19329_02090 [Legionella antarctica]|uniref:Aminotransferase class I/classII large domain-containing protein n=1 Tax=Legionella antarctica TaxID=2708020 RepID=A0A6F8T073_9GAMM|nr:pyridoxal phosphate-dependent aminotransferase [Legionella antarctica]BCA93848.1 hypothetical protein TUM19329_02090 [Legionella antarctica]
MLLKDWTDTLKEETSGLPRAKPLIYAGMGKPTFPVSLHTVKLQLAFWQGMERLITEANNDIRGSITESLAIDYGDGNGDILPRRVMAEAMSNWYNAPVTEDNILFTVGGAGALNTIFETFNHLYKDIPLYRVITPFPHYSLYAANERHQLHPIDVMKEPGYQLTAAALEASIKSAYLLAEQDNNLPKVVLLCNPSNPLGTIIPEDELKKIAAVLRKYSDLKIVMDEAYAEMCWTCQKVPSLLELAPDLGKQIVILRSATKALSMAGERWGMMMAFDPELMTEFRNQNIKTTGHAPRTAQLMYAKTMEVFDDKQKQELQDYYLPKVEYVYQRAKEMGASMPDPAYKIEGSFYVLCDLSDLLGEDIPTEAKRALGQNTTGKIRTSEELVYALLFQDSVMVAPGSYFGMDPNNGFIRITCSGTLEQLEDLMDRIENRLKCALQNKTNSLITEINKQMANLANINGDILTLRQKISCQLSLTKKYSENILALKAQNVALKNLLSDLENSITGANPRDKECAKPQLPTFFSPANKALKPQEEHAKLKTEWRTFINKVFLDGGLKNIFLTMTEEDKKTFLPWVEHLKSIENNNLSRNKEDVECESASLTKLS